jgi:ornithine cyclodeaminase
MLILNALEVEESLPMLEVITAMKDAYAALSAGSTKNPLRTRITTEYEIGEALFMPAYLKQAEQQILCLKSVTIFPGNIDKDLPTIQAAVLVLNGQTGQVEAILEGGKLTAIRTGAASGAATDLLARPDCKVGAIFGAGVQGRTQLQAICSVRSLERVWVFDPLLTRAEAFVNDMAGLGSIPVDLKVAKTSSEAIRNADIICTATTSLEPVFQAADIKPGTHINGIGSYRPDMIEISPEVLSKASLFVGSMEGVMAEAGEILAALKIGLIDAADLIEIGNVVMKTQAGRISQDQITYFKSVGVAVQDAAAASLALSNARKKGLGVEVLL